MKRILFPEEDLKLRRSQLRLLSQEHLNDSEDYCEAARKCHAFDARRGEKPQTS